MAIRKNIYFDEKEYEKTAGHEIKVWIKKVIVQQ